MRVINDYSDISVEWFLGDEGELEDWTQGTLPTPQEFQPQRARMFLVYLQMGMTERQAMREVPVDPVYMRSWKRGSHGAPKSFLKAYELARTEQTHKMAEEIVDIADGTDRITESYLEEAIANTKNPFKPDDTDLPSVIKAAMRDARDRSAMRIDVRKWMASKRLPFAYGDRLSLEHTGDKEKPVKLDMKKLTTEQLEALAKLDEELNGSGS